MDSGSCCPIVFLSTICWGDGPAAPKWPMAVGSREVDRTIEVMLYLLPMCTYIQAGDQEGLKCQLGGLEGQLGDLEGQ